jgi:glycosyltransferase involved in cell wall biosynthesis
MGNGLAGARGRSGAAGEAMRWLMHIRRGCGGRWEMRARQHVVEHFSLEAVLDRWERLYAELLERKNAERRIVCRQWEI